MTTTLVGGAEAPAVRRVELDVSGMTCAACAARVETRLNKLDGVRASVNYATRVATVDAPDGLTSDALGDVVHRAGCQAAVRSAGSDERADPDDATARSLLLRLAVAAAPVGPLSPPSGVFAGPPRTPLPRWPGGVPPPHQRLHRLPQIGQGAKADRPVERVLIGVSCRA